MKNKNGFTLIELLAVIVILAIIALIAVPIVLNMIENARKSAAKSSAYGYIQAIDDNNELYEMNDDYGLTIEEIKGTNIPVSSINLNIKGKKPTSGTVTIDAKGRVSNATLCINNYTVTYNGTEASVGSKGCEGGSTPQTYAAYSIGDPVQIGGTDWYVIEDSSESESTVKLMSKLNINKSVNASSQAADLFNTSGNKIAFDTGGSNVYANSSIKRKLEGDFKDAIEGALGITVNSIGMWGKEELETLGCTVTWDSSATPAGATAITCDSTKPWYNNILKGSYTWMNVPRAGSNYIWLTYATEGIYANCPVDNDGSFGVRPVITINKSQLQ